MIRGTSGLSLQPVDNLHQEKPHLFNPAEEPKQFRYVGLRDQRLKPGVCRVLLEEGSARKAADSRDLLTDSFTSRGPRLEYPAMNDACRSRSGMKSSAASPASKKSLRQSP